MVTTSLHVDIRRPLEEVFHYLMDPQNYLVWQSGVLEIQASNGMAAGSVLSFVALGLGQKYKMQAVVTENDQHSSFTVVAHQGPITFESTYRLRPVPTGTRVELHMKIDPGVVFRLAQSALQSISDSRYEADLKSLKAILED
jgi:ligand-binding SRPBCC domain-containing protein